MVHFVGAGPGAPDLITQRGAALLQTADCIIYAGSLVNPALLGLAKADCTIYNSAKMTLEDVISVMRENEKNNKTTVRLHTGDPCLYGAIREQMDRLDAESLPYDDTPGVLQLLRRGGSFKRRIYVAVCQSNGYHHAHGRPHARAGKRKAGKPCRPRGKRWSFSYPSALWTKYSRRFWQAVPIRRIPRQRWCIRPHGRRKKRCAAP